MNAKERKALVSFLFWARRNHGYASDAIGTKLALGGKEFRCSRGKLSYWDHFWCFDPFMGQEMIWHDDKGWIWGMNYYGLADKKLAGCAKISADIIYTFLMEALLDCDPVAPFRGRKNHSAGEGEWVYENDWEPWSTLERFCGSEKIFVKNILVYRGEYHGGIIKEK